MSSKKNVKAKANTPQTRTKKRKQSKMGLIITIAAIAFIAIIAAVLVTQTGLLKASSPKSTPSPTPAATATPTSSSSGPYPSVTMLTSPAGEYSTSSTMVLFVTSKGDIVIQLRNDKPVTTANFVKLVNMGYYNDTTFMRVIAGFMIQGGEGKTTEPSIENLETGDGNSNLNMTIAMANAGGTATASTQFFINVADNSDLNTGYTVFGQVIYGQSTVMAISNVPVEYSSTYQEDSQPITTVYLIGAVVMP